MFFATQRHIYAAERSTLLGSLPENAPPPCLPVPPYVSTMIFLPVSPESPWGPPTTKLPVGLTKNWVFLVMSFFGRTFLTTFSTMYFSISECETPAACWVETTTFSMYAGLPFSYATATWLLQSGRSHFGALPPLRCFANSVKILCANIIGAGMSSGVSFVA